LAVVKQFEPETPDLSDQLKKLLRSISLASHHAPSILRLRRSSPKIGAGLGSTISPCLVAAIPISLFGISLSKWLGTSIGSLVRRKRARGETIVAMVGAIAGLGGALLGQIAPLIFKYADVFKSLRWTPPGAAASLIAGTTAGRPFSYAIDFLNPRPTQIKSPLSRHIERRHAALGLGVETTEKGNDSYSNSEGYSG
jgi:hypothetical protein